ncbi:hypothetical protein IW262DRAFT_1264621 [Armillaria fumosa]|nr:hypothetical protein IW262DRAFT_1264621 [Armillaria fumosa]
MVIVHNIAQSGFGSGTNELYARMSRDCPTTALSAIKEIVKAKAPFNAVEIGAGTGLFKKTLLKSPYFSAIRKSRAVEPNARTRDVFVKTVHDERVSAREGTFDTTNIKDGWANVLLTSSVHAQVFRWCPDFDVTSIEFARNLRPESIVGSFPPYSTYHRKQIEQHKAGTPQFRLGLWRKTFDTDSYKKLFQAPVQKTWAFI